MESDEEILHKRSLLNRHSYHQKITDAAEALFRQNQATTYTGFDSATGLARLRDQSGNIFYALAQTSGAIALGETVRTRAGTYDAMPAHAIIEPTKEAKKTEQYRMPILFFEPEYFDLYRLSYRHRSWDGGSIKTFQAVKYYLLPQGSVPEFFISKTKWLSNQGIYYDEIPNEYGYYVGEQTIDLAFTPPESWANFRFDSLGNQLKQGLYISTLGGGTLVANSVVTSTAYVGQSGTSFTGEILNYSIDKLDIFNLSATGFEFTDIFNDTYYLIDDFVFTVNGTAPIVFRRAKFFLGGDRKPVLLAEIVWNDFTPSYVKLTVTKKAVYIGLRTDYFSFQDLYAFIEKIVFQNSGGKIDFTQITPVTLVSGSLVLGEPIMTGEDVLNGSWDFPSLTTTKTYSLPVANNKNNDITFPYADGKRNFFGGFFENNDAIFYGNFFENNDPIKNNSIFYSSDDESEYNTDLRILRSEDTQVTIRVDESGKNTKYVKAKVKSLASESAIILAVAPYLVKV